MSDLRDQLLDLIGHQDLETYYNIHNETHPMREAQVKRDALMRKIEQDAVLPAKALIACKAMIRAVNIAPRAGPEMDAAFWAAYDQMLAVVIEAEHADA